MTTETQLRAVPRTVIGSPVQVRTALVTAFRTGRLVSSSPARRVGRGLVRVEVVLMEPTFTTRPAQKVSKPRSVPTRYKVVGAVVTAAVVVLATVGVLMAVLIEWVMAHATQVIGAGSIVVVLALTLAYLCRGHACSGLHCAGCSR